MPQRLDDGIMIVAGVDEVGRGPIAGPLLVVAAAFEVDDPYALPPCPIAGVKDSKAFATRAKREVVSKAIEAAPTFRGRGRGAVTAADITERGMSWALRVAFRRAVETLPISPDLVLVDGSSGISGWPGKQLWGPKGDSRWWPVSAASILAKVARDGWMDRLDRAYPGFGFAKNSGYGTPAHFAALRGLSATPVHRKKFVASHFRET